MSPRAPLAVLLALAVAGGAAAPASAVTIGISDQHAPMFDNPHFAPLGIGHARLVVPWNVALKPRAERQEVADWLAGAQRMGVEPHVAFGEPTYARHLHGKGPTPARFRVAVAAFHKRWPHVRAFTPWNEQTHKWAPTFKRPRLAARYYHVVRSVCPTCRVVAADLLDLPNLGGWLRRFLRHVKGKPRLWGLHNYRDANRFVPFRDSWTLKLPSLVKGKIWVTESGGINGLETDDGRLLWDYNPRRQARSLRHLLRLVGNRRVSSRYERLYVYSFYGAWERGRRFNRWDSGLLTVDQRPRPAYGVLKRAVRRGIGGSPGRGPLRVP